MLELTITATGKTYGDLELAIEEALKSVRAECSAGYNSNDTGSYAFNVSGDAEDYESVTIKYPRVWDDLMNVIFYRQEDEFDKVEGNVYVDIATCEKGHHRSDLDDPLPYYDDHRQVTVTLDSGEEIELHLNSGQGNYWAELIVYSEDGDQIAETDALESLDDTEVETEDGEVYKVTLEPIDWKGSE